MPAAPGVIPRFLDRARRLAKELRLPPGSAEEGVAILRTAFSEEWITSAANNPGRKFTSNIFRSERHPVGAAFAIAGASQVVEMLELAAYLRRLARVARLGEAVAQLKSNYDHALLQLSLAYRLERIGITLECFEPETGAGQLGDILVWSQGRPCVVECYCPQGETDYQAHELHELAGCLDRFHGRPIRVDIRLKEPITHRERKVIQSLLGQLDVSAVVAADSWDLGFAHVRVEPIEARRAVGTPDDSLPRDCGDASWILQVGKMYEDDMEKLGIDEGIEVNRSSQLRVWLPTPSEKRDDLRFAGDLAAKISRKMSQAQRADASGRLVAALVAGVEDRNDRVRNLARVVAETMNRKHSSWNGVLLVSRRWMPDSRYMHFGAWIPGNAPPTLADDQFMALNRLEETMDVLVDLVS